MMDCIRLRSTTILCAALLAPGCVVVSDNDPPADSTTDDSAGPGPTTATNSTTATTSPDTTTGPDPDDTTGDDGFPEHCSDNLIEDGSFEGGTPNEAWEEHSDIFGTPICDASCTEDSGAAPFAGEWFVWFGGLEDGQEDVASVSQRLVIPPDTAHLRFRLAMSGNEPSGDNVMAVEIDETTVFMVTDLDQASYEGYKVVDVEVSEFADGEVHDLRFVAEFPGGVLTNFFLDEVELVSCDEGTETTGTTTGTGTTTTDATDSSTGADDTTGGEAESSSTGGNGD